MSRRTRPHDLPPLADLHPHFVRLPQDLTALQATADLLRATLARVRRELPRPFYTQREIARFCGVPQRTVHLACRRLAAEGLLTCLRGSGMLAHGRRLQPRVPPRGVVGLPIWMFGFTHLPHWQLFFTSLEEELRRENFVSDMVFYSQQRDARPDFAETLLSHHLDTLVWLYPLPAAYASIARLADGGVRAIVVAEGFQPPPGTSRLHATHWKRAYECAFAAWRAGGITDAVFVEPPGPPAPPDTSVREAAADAGLRCRFEPFVRATGPRGPQTGIVFVDEFSLLVHLERDPGDVLELMRRTRVLIRNSIPHRFTPPDVRVDVVAIDWPRLARQVAREIAAPQALAARRPVSVQARWHPRAPAAAFADPS